MLEESDDKEIAALSLQAQDIITNMDLETPLDCRQCPGEVAMYLNVAPNDSTGKLELTAISYKCAHCQSRTVVWQA